MRLHLLLLLLALPAALSECPNSCSSAGDCGVLEQCRCYPGFFGGDCSLRHCPADAAFVDTPLGDLNHDGAVSGAELWPGGAQPGEAHFPRECSNQGTCSHATGLCSCFPGYTGAACQREQCPGACSGKGHCHSLGALADTGLYSGFPYHLWDAHKRFTCVCDPGYAGPDCSQRACPVAAPPGAPGLGGSLAFSVPGGQVAGAYQLTLQLQREGAPPLTLATPEFLLTSDATARQAPLLQRNTASVQAALSALPSWALGATRVSVWGGGGDSAAGGPQLRVRIDLLAQTTSSSGGGAGLRLTVSPGTGLPQQPLRGAAWPGTPGLGTALFQPGRPVAFFSLPASPGLGAGATLLQVAFPPPAHSAGLFSQPASSVSLPVALDTASTHAVALGLAAALSSVPHARALGHAFAPGSAVLAQVAADLTSYTLLLQLPAGTPDAPPLAFRTAPTAAALLAAPWSSATHLEDNAEPTAQGAECGGRGVCQPATGLCLCAEGARGVDCTLAAGPASAPTPLPLDAPRQLRAAAAAAALTGALGNALQAMASPAQALAALRGTDLAVIYGLPASAFSAPGQLSEAAVSLLSDAFTYAYRSAGGCPRCIGWVTGVEQGSAAGAGVADGGSPTGATRIRFVVTGFFADEASGSGAAAAAGGGRRMAGEVLPSGGVSTGQVSFYLNVNIRASAICDAVALHLATSAPAWQVVVVLPLSIVAVTQTPSPTQTPTQTPTNSPTPSITPSNSPTISFSSTRSPTPSVSGTLTPTPTYTRSPTQTSSQSPTPSRTPSLTATVSPSVTATVTVTPSVSPTFTPSPSVTPSFTTSTSATRSQTPSKSPTQSFTPTVSPSRTPTANPQWTRLTAQGGGWQGITINTDGSIIIAVSSSLIKRSGDSGATWATVSSVNKNYVGVGSNFALTSIWAMTNGDYPYVSRDLGLTFTPFNTAPISTTGWSASTVSDDGTVVALVTFGGSMFVSTNGGTTFTTRSGGDMPSVAMNSDGTRIYTIHRGDPIKVSTNYGATSTTLTNSWPTIASQGAPADINGGAWLWYGIACSTDGTKIVANGRGNNNFGGNYQGSLISVSLDSGATWTAPSFTGQFQNWYHSAASADGTVMLATADGTTAQGTKANAMTNAIWLSTNSGSTWTQHIPALAGVAEPGGWEPVAVSGNGKVIVAAGSYLWMYSR